MAEYKYPEQESCPIVHEDRDIQIYTNSCGEVFVEHKATKVVMRFSGDQKGIQFTAFGHRVDPVPVGGGIGWRVHN